MNENILKMLIKGLSLIMLVLIPVIIFISRIHTPTQMSHYVNPTPTHIPIPTSSAINNVPESPTAPENTSSVITISPTQIITHTLTTDNVFFYPNSSLHSQSSHNLSLVSQDDPAVITNWYKITIQQLGLNTTSFITTNTNGNISNKLVASNATQQIDVEITKSNASNQVSISVSN